MMSPGAARQKRLNAAVTAYSTKSPRTTEKSCSSRALITYEWPNDPVSVVDGRDYYESIRISTHQTTFSVSKGGAIVLSTENDNLICRVNRFFVQTGNDGSPVKVEGRWFLRHKDLVAKLGSAITPDSEEFVDRLEVQELVLTNMVEENDIASIEGTCHIQYMKAGQNVPSLLHPNTFFCRYKLDIDTVNKTLEWENLDTADTDFEMPVEVAGMNIDETDMEMSVKEDYDHLVDEMLSSNSDDDSASASSVEEIFKVTIQEGEGATLRGDIQVGSKYQVKVGPFVNGLTVRSRGPKLIYKANRISNNEMHDFLNKVADVHNSYLCCQGMTMEEPYSPLSQDRAEEIMQENLGYQPLTGSFMSTASMLAGNRSRLLKECSADALLESLADHDFCTNAALEGIKSNLNGITVGWTRPEKSIFDDGFRRHQGALRMIAKAISPTKTIKDVIDYYYRFKIPDQFRKYQDKKREQAVRIVECIETRKHHESITLQCVATASTGNNENSAKPTHWYEKPVSCIADVKDERVRTAKKLLLDVKDKYGRDKMAEVASVIRQLQSCYQPDARENLFTLINDQLELQKRFLEFLPKHF